MADAYPNIEDHRLIGDLQTAAPVDLSLINAAVNLDDQLDHGSGFVEPVLSKGRRTTEPATH
jgi:hypothetical protein